MPTTKPASRGLCAFWHHAEARLGSAARTAGKSHRPARSPPEMIKGHDMQDIELNLSDLSDVGGVPMMFLFERGAVAPQYTPAAIGRDQQ